MEEPPGTQDELPHYQPNKQRHHHFQHPLEPSLFPQPIPN
jgi:hypothetical protein